MTESSETITELRVLKQTCKAAQQLEALNVLNVDS